jgi:hypothetical protein
LTQRLLILGIIQAELELDPLRPTPRG